MGQRRVARLFCARLVGVIVRFLDCNKFAQETSAVTFHVSSRFVCTFWSCGGVARLGFAMRESFGWGGLVVFFCRSQAIQAEWVVVAAGYLVFVSVVARAESLLADDVPAFDAPLPGASEKVPYACEFLFWHRWGEERAGCCLVQVRICGGGAGGV